MSMKFSPECARGFFFRLRKERNFMSKMKYGENYARRRAVLSRFERKGLLASPNHGDRSSQTSAHVKREKTFYPFNLARAGLVAQLLVGIKNLAHTRRTHRMAVANQTAAGINRDFPCDFAFNVFAPDLRKRSCPAFRQL